MASACRDSEGLSTGTWLALPSLHYSLVQWCDGKSIVEYMNSLVLITVSPFMNHSLAMEKGLMQANEAISHTMQAHPRWTAHSGEFWQNVVQWRKKWQTTPTFSRHEYWSGLPCSPPKDLPNPGIEPVSLMTPVLAGGFFSTSSTWEVCQHIHPPYSCYTI